MLFLFVLLFYLAPETLTRAIPPLSSLFSAGLTEATTTVTYPSNEPSALLIAVSRDVATCTCPPQQRSISDIIWSCLATIFACAWVSVHPDVPSPDEKWWQKSLRRIEYLVWTLLTPELIVWWAARQWMGAREIQEEQKDRKWTITHGHFMQMGGFMLFKGKKRIGTLSYPAFHRLLEQGRIEFPDITQEEIQDRSKSDGLSKALVITQTGWFVIQCIARRVQSLPITELELLTLALAALNGVMYFFWWNKPFDVQCPVPVHLILPTDSKASIPAPTSNNETTDHEVSTTTTPDATSIDETTDPEISSPEPTSNEETPSTSKDPLLPAGSQRKNPQLKQMSTSVLKWPGWKKMITWPWTLINFVGVQLDQMVNCDDRDEFESAHTRTGVDDSHGTPGLMRVPMFYSRKVDSTGAWGIFVITFLIGSLFGAIHCAGWDFQFPTDAELWLWRISSLFITIAPLSLCLLCALLVILDEVEWPWWVRAPWTWLARVARSLLARAGRTWLARTARTWLDRASGTWLGTAAYTLYVCTYDVAVIVVFISPFLLYIVARLILMAEAISTLRDLPPGALDVVQWTSFLPHI